MDSMICNTLLVFHALTAGDSVSSFGGEERRRLLGVYGKSIQWLLTDLKIYSLCKMKSATMQCQSWSSLWCYCIAVNFAVIIHVYGDLCLKVKFVNLMFVVY